MDLVGQDALGLSNVRARAGFPKPVPNGRLNAALGFMENHYARGRVTLAETARTARLSKWHLERLIKRYTGISFLQNLRAIRMRQVEHLLEETGASIKEIAARAGYANASTLDRDFRRCHDCSPREWRIRHAAPAQLLR
jgi:AraC-like DNA-binding protein